MTNTDFPLDELVLAIQACVPSGQTHLCRSQAHATQLSATELLTRGTQLKDQGNAVFKQVRNTEHLLKLA